MSEPYYQDESVTLWHGDCLEVLRTLPDASVDSVVTDPPYGLEFMGKDWDAPWEQSGVNADAGFGALGMADGYERLPRPSFTGSTNPKCLVCKGTRRGRRDGTAKVAVCLCEDGGRFPNHRAVEMRAFAEWCETWTAECLRVLKPGGHMLAFGGSRTWHRLAVAIEDAGFEIRDSIAWLYGSGFPKSLDVSKAIDKMDATEERRARALRFTAWMRSTGITSRQIDEATGTRMGGHYLTAESQPAVATVAHLDALRPLLPTVPEWVEDMARQRTVESENFKERGVIGKAYRLDRKEGHVNYGGGTPDGHYDLTAPATPDAERWQGWGTALKPAFEPIVVARKPLAGTVAANVLAHGTGALNVDGCRVGDAGGTTRQGTPDRLSASGAFTTGHGIEALNAGRWPTNVVLDDTQAAELDRQSGTLTSGKMQPTHTLAERKVFGQNAAGGYTTMETYGDSGGASRFFPTFRYEAKAPTSERPRNGEVAHPTVKPLDLMRWLVRLVTPPGGTVLEPFAGSGTTVEACLIEGFRCIAIEREADYLPLITARIAQVQPVLDLDGVGA